VRPGARDLLDLVLDEGSYVSWDQPVDATSYDGDYAAAVRKAHERAGTDEALLTGCGRIRGHRVAVVVGEFRFLTGSIGAAAADRLVAAVERATAAGLPLLAAPASSGTRMQEGTPAFVQMVRITRAIVAHKNARLPYLVYLRHPTIGGVLASWGSLGHVTVAEPGALIGFLGPRVYEALHRRPFPPGVQVAENLADKGIIDGVVKAADLPETTARILDMLVRPVLPAGPRADPPEPGVPGPAWDSVLRTRKAGRPGIRDVLRHAPEETIPLSGTTEGERDRGLLLALRRFDGVAAVLIGQDRNRQADAPLGPGAFREARRGMRLAQEFGLPLVTVIDTPGAALSQDGEEGGIAGEMARCLVDMSSLDVPTVSVLLGQGTGGGALALLPADRVVAAQHAWLAPLPPEGASAIMYGDVAHAAEMADRQQVDSGALLATGVVHRIVPELPDAADEPVDFSRRLLAAVGAELRSLVPPD
jgi:acetyl-CoA carboxylase beta subunit/acetyl-CoA carboxylase alpha subunit